MFPFSAVWEDPEDIKAIASTAVALSCSFISSAEADSISWKLGSTAVGTLHLNVTFYLEIKDFHQI